MDEVAKKEKKKTRKLSGVKTITRAKVLKNKTTKNSHCPSQASANSQVTYNLVLMVMH